MFFERRQDKSLQTSVISAVIGSAVASITVMLWDQKKRKNLVDNISHTFQDLKDRAQNSFDDIADRVSDETDELKSKAPLKKERRIAKK